MNAQGIFLYKALLFAAFITYVSISASFAIDNTEPLAQPVLPMVRAMGGAYVAVADDENTVFYNPAGYGALKDSTVTVFSLGIKLNVDESAVDVYNALLKGENITASENVAEFLNDTTLAVTISGPIYFGRVGNNFGFAFYDNVDLLLDTTPGGISPFAEYLVYSDLGFVGGLGFELPFVDNLYTGVNFKVILRLKSEVEGTVISVIDTITDTPLAKSVGFGGDVGLLYRPFPWLSFGLTGRDFFGTRFNTWENLSGSTDFPKSMIKPRIAFGVAFSPLKTGKQPEPEGDLVIALDYFDLLDYSPVLSNIKFGLKFTTLKFLDLRGGFDGGYLTGGIGFNFKIFHTSLVYYVDELGVYPGSRPTQNFVTNFAIKW